MKILLTFVDTHYQDHLWSPLHDYLRKVCMQAQVC